MASGRPPSAIALAYQQALAGWAAQRRAGTPVSLAEVLHTLCPGRAARTAAGADLPPRTAWPLLTLAVNMSGRGWAKLLPLAQATAGAAAAQPALGGPR